MGSFWGCILLEKNGKPSCFRGFQVVFAVLEVDAKKTGEIGGDDVV